MTAAVISARPALASEKNMPVFGDWNTGHGLPGQRVAGLVTSLSRVARLISPPASHPACRRRSRGVSCHVDRGEIFGVLDRTDPLAGIASLLGR